MTMHILNLLMLCMPVYFVCDMVNVNVKSQNYNCKQVNCCMCEYQNT